MNTINGNINIFQAVTPKPGRSVVGHDALSNSVGVDNAPVISAKNSSTVTISSLANARLDEAVLAGPVSMTVADAIEAANGNP
ncbi:MAG: hypothetical protein EBU34_11785, partial [Alphaproteobacteria bacterium]|nr:hypothetical protein [Alphaproteobacteria bacterium]